MNLKYMVEMWWMDKREEPKDFVWYHATVKDAVAWARAYGKQKGAAAFVVLHVFNTGHYRTKHTESLQ